MTVTEINDIAHRWNEWLNLEKAFDDLIPVSLCLDAQVRFNERHKLEPQFMRMNVPLVIRVFRESQAYKRNHFVNYREAEDAPQIYMFKTKWQVPEPSGRSNNHLNNERDYLERLAPEITKEVDALFGDVMNEEITFYGIGCLNDGTLTLSFKR